jgi:hypothetical protein
MSKKYIVIIVDSNTGEKEEALPGEHDIWKAEKIAAGIDINLNHDEYMVKVEEVRPLKEGDLCTVERLGDIWFLSEARPFIEKECIFIKVTKAGLYQVALKSNPKLVMSFAKSHISAIE